MMKYRDPMADWLDLKSARRNHGICSAELIARPTLKRSNAPLSTLDVARDISEADLLGSDLLINFKNLPASAVLRVFLDWLTFFTDYFSRPIWTTAQSNVDLIVGETELPFFTEFSHPEKEWDGIFEGHKDQSLKHAKRDIYRKSRPSVKTDGAGFGNEETIKEQRAGLKTMLKSLSGFFSNQIPVVTDIINLLEKITLLEEGVDKEIKLPFHSIHQLQKLVKDLEFYPSPKGMREVSTPNPWWYSKKHKSSKRSPNK